MTTTTSTTMATLLFRTTLAPSCSFKNIGAMNYNSVFLRSSAVRRMCVRASGQSAHTLLGVERGATKAEIKKAYRRLALQYHPDVCLGDHCSAQFQLIKAAYEALMAGTALPLSPSDSSDDLECFIDRDDECWEEFDEWMGWEGAGTLDYLTPIDDAN